MATRKNAAAAGPTATFKVLSPLSHDGEDYAIGDQVELTEAQALALGPQVVEPVLTEKPKS